MEMDLLLGFEDHPDVAEAGVGGVLHLFGHLRKTGGTSSHSSSDHVFSLKPKYYFLIS